MKKTKTKRVSKKVAEILNKPTWCHYHDKKLVPQIIVRRYDMNGHRFYYFLYSQAVKTAIGVTSAYGAVATSDEREGIERWKKNNPLTWDVLFHAAAEYGTSLHIVFENLSLKKAIDKFLLDNMVSLAVKHGKSADMPTKDTLALMKFLEDFKVKILLVEAQLVWRCPETGEFLALTIDTLAQIDDVFVEKKEVQDGVYLRGERKGQPKMVVEKTEIPRTRIMVGDLKSNFFEKDEKSFYKIHKMQLIAGMKAVEQNFGIKVDGCFNLSPNNWRSAPSYTYFEHDIAEKDLRSFDAKWKYILAEEINTPKGNILVCDNPKSSSDYKLMSYLEYAEQQLLPQPIV